MRGTLLGPEGSDRLLLARGCGRVVGVGVGCLLSGATGMSARLCGCGGGWPGCWLRTVQWTRASLWL